MLTFGDLQFLLFWGVGSISGARTRHNTKRKRIAEALRESEANFRAVVNYMPVLFYMKDMDGRYRLINKAFERWCGVDTEKIIG